MYKLPRVAIIPHNFSTVKYVQFQGKYTISPQFYSDPELLGHCTVVNTMTVALDRMKDLKCSSCLCRANLFVKRNFRLNVSGKMYILLVELDTEKIAGGENDKNLV